MLLGQQHSQSNAIDMKTIIISGGSSGIGAATADLFSQKGYKVYDLSRSGQNRNSISHIACDVTVAESCKAAVEQVIKEQGRIDVVICNAGFGISGPVEFTDTASVKRQMDVNFFGALNLAQAVLPHMREAHSGRIFFTTSVAALLPIPYQSFYSASKAAVNAMAQSLQNEVRPFGIQVSCLLPGDVSTGFTSARNKCEAGNSVYTHAKQSVEVMEKDELGGMKPKEMAQIYWHMAECKRPKMYYIGGSKYKVFCMLQKFLPTSLVNWIEGQVYYA